ncbi:protein lin-28 homolog B isoform X1 [Electrophorus electricus]|uniref:protein lin-28 homolog B isoform X1 n=1 Tax=Electrophorus electricus TaxID=8005 RepID=UPI0015CFDAAB|nr:protein lin-28 homolog B isoform X1 [Electrophorus electricus]
MAVHSATGGTGKGGGADPARSHGQEERTPPQFLVGSGYCKWFNGRMGFGFISMTHSEGRPVDPPLDVFVHQSKLVMDGFRSLREGEPVDFTFKRSSKGLESLRVTGPGGGPCSGSERHPRGKAPPPKRKPKGDRCYNCGGLDHHAKECGLPPQPKKCHYCQSVMHMVSQCPHKGAESPSSSQEPPPCAASTQPQEGGGRFGSFPQERPSPPPDEPPRRGAHAQRWRKPRD